MSKISADFAELIDSYPEINPTNYSYDDVCALNNWGYDVVCAFKAAEREQDSNAAPDLLAALTLLLKEVDESAIAGASDYGWPSAVAKSRAAILKATGGAP